tara:strand:+ start:1864 stop:2466 length:603 start_codon:yes stop_codon:yes gene_type:complete
MKILLSIFILIFTIHSLSKADNLNDFQIEEMSIGDSALKYLSKNQILDEIEFTKNHYIYLKYPLKFREVYIFNVSNSSNYDKISFMVKEKDPNYKIFFLRGMKTYNNQFDKCINQRNKIANEIEKLFINYEKEEHELKNALDKSGKSFRKQIIFIFNSGDVITVGCSDWNEELRTKNNWTEGLNVAIITKEIVEWFDQKK